MYLVNTETIPGKEIVEMYGVVSGSTVRAKHVGRDIMAGLKNIVGGELQGYTELLQESRKEAMDRMVMQAQSMGANAVVIFDSQPLQLHRCIRAVCLWNCSFSKVGAYGSINNTYCSHYSGIRYWLNN